MCGIAGIIEPRSEPAAREAAVARMLERQRSRGPDQSGIISFPDATIGMCRLAIIDPGNGRQPMSSPDGRHHLVFNGAIYNHAELRGAYRARGWSFHTNCDTEVLLAALVMDGESCLNRLRGMFAFALYDTAQRTLFAARDPLGIKPFYFARLASGGTIFGSEIKAILASGAIEPGIDPAAVGEFLAWFSVPSPRTIFRGVQNLPPGFLCTIDNRGRPRTRAWWSLPDPTTPRAVEAAHGESYDRFVAGLRRQLEDSIEAHQIADVPVGAFLSGGLDSTSIVALMARKGGRKVKTFSLVFNEAEFSEQEPARLAAKAIGTDHHEEVLTASRVVEDLPAIIDAFDQPTGDGINTYYVSRAAHNGGVKVALSGLGGDELFGGYPSFRHAPRLVRILRLAHVLPAPLVREIAIGLRNGGTRPRKLADFLTHARDLHEVCSLQRRVLSEATRLALLSPDAFRAAERLGANHPRLDDFAFELLGADVFQTVSAWEMRTYMADVLLRDSDVFSMAHSIELRVPFVDARLLEWLWPQPRAFKFDAARTKAALADAVADVVPAQILRREKKSFTLPFARWMRSELRPFLEETFSNASLSRCPWLNRDAVQKVWRDYLAASDTREWSRVWTLAILVAFVTRRGVSAPPAPHVRRLAVA